MSNPTVTISRQPHIMGLRLSNIIRRSRCAQRISSSIVTRDYHSLPPVQTVDYSFDDVDLDEFRQKAFIPEKPVSLRSTNGASSTSLGKKSSIKIAEKWFMSKSQDQCANLDMTRKETSTLVPTKYLEYFADTTLPYELTVDSPDVRNQLDDFMRHYKFHVGFSEQLQRSIQPHDSTKTFYHFYAPLTLFLLATSSNYPLPLYIAQAQIADLPRELQKDLPMPKVVKEAGKGDVYDANIWLGTSTSYTPLHKDPNPNLFIQSVGKKRVRLFPPIVGRGIYQDVQQSIGAWGIASIRGEEMMEGPERSLLEQRVWGEGVTEKGFEVEVGPGDALFIPKGWWHSIKSLDGGISASVNWWFR
ncbi:3234ccdd-933c-4a5c-a6c6-aa35bbc30f72 [Sclerotinia trifoliorum]|uniref:3234ccdd-933c-4a5c-a6c6-aa35bbc30f72 n=1 Tax=Sclerotinia trifoliorum TaxID=28548 RepID=A0A8H2VYM8_9HELO|nr:3234ccdd-933c-4a5c-a6c6-aa35bbc30f72 [Sclerotinia trifoliorum]